MPKIRLLLAAITVLVVVVAALLVPVPYKGRSASTLGDLVHAPLFGSLGLATLWAWKQLSPIQRFDSELGRRLAFRGFVVWVLLSLFGLGMELLQSMSGGRSGTLHDTIANSLGVAAAVCGYACVWFFSERRPAVGSVLLGAAIALLAIGWYRPARMLWDVLAVPRRFPLLASFESEFALERWFPREAELKLSRKYVTHGDHSLWVTFQPIDFTAITLFEMPKDWSDATSMEVDATLDSELPEESVTLFLQIVNERDGVSKTKEFELRRGETTRLQWPDLQRLGMDLSEVRYLDVGISDPTEPISVYFDRLLLKLKPEEISTE